MSNTGKVLSIRRGILLSAGRKSGYLAVILQYKGRRRQVYVHRLVAEAFLQESPTQAQINHIDGVKTNNTLPNLEWVTAQENMRHAFAKGLHNLHGSRCITSKLTSRQVNAIRVLDGVLSHKEIADLFKVGSTTIGYIISGKTWKKA